MVLGWVSADCEYMKPDGKSDSPPVISAIAKDSSDRVEATANDTAKKDLGFDINPNLNSRQRKIFQLILKRFQHCFVSSESEVTLLKGVPETDIKLQEDKIVRRPPYKLSPAEFKFLQTQMKGLEEGGLIKRSRSPFRNSVIVIRKGNGEFKAAWDFRPLNKL